MLKPSLTTFAQVCSIGSFTKAAAKLYVTPSAVMQQMDALEQEYGVKLFLRTHQGVRPTEAGEYLWEEVKEMAHRSGQIRARLTAIASEDDMVCVGTSLIEKCRLLYDLWALYSEHNPNCRIQMVNNSMETGIPDCADMVESLNSGIGWMLKWQFYEICKVPIGIAMENTHPLSQQTVIEPSMLENQQIAAFRGTTHEGLSQLFHSLEQIGAKLIWLDMPSPSAFWECAFQHRLLLAPMCWADILPGFTLRPVRWPYALPYGIFSRKNPRKEPERFMQFIQKTYNDKDPNTIIPILTY